MVPKIASDFCRFRIESEGGARRVVRLSGHVRARDSHTSAILPFVDREAVLPVCRWISAEIRARFFARCPLSDSTGLRSDLSGKEMAAEGEASNGAILRSLLELAAGGEEGAQQQLAASAGLSTENVAQLLAAAIAQVGQSILSSQQPQVVAGDEAVCDKKAEGEGGVAPTPPSTTTAGCDILTINPLMAAAPPAVFDLREAYESVPQASTLTDVETADVATTVEVPAAAGERRPLCVKFPIELRKRIISMRKSGKLCKDIAKELKVSVSGVQKVWERFLATGMAHDRKPSTYAGRPRKTTFSQVREKNNAIQK